MTTNLDERDAQRASDGDGAAFAELVRRYQDRIYRFLLRLTRSPDDALDLTQETFLRAYQGIERWRPEALFRTWLFRIARNQAFDRLRRDRRVEFIELEQDADIASGAPGPDALLEARQSFHLLEQALVRLPAQHREILLLREIEEMSYDDIAMVLDLNIGTVKSRIARARSALLDNMQRAKETSS